MATPNCCRHWANKTHHQRYVSRNPDNRGCSRLACQLWNPTTIITVFHLFRIADSFSQYTREDFESVLSCQHNVLFNKWSSKFVNICCCFFAIAILFQERNINLIVQFCSRWLDIFIMHDPEISQIVLTGIFMVMSYCKG